MSDLLTIDNILWALAALSLVWAFVPPIVTALGLYRVRGTAVEDPRAVEPSGDDPEYAQKYRELRDLGFAPMGVLTEHYWLFAFHWYKAFPARCLASADRTCYAAVFRFMDGPLRVRFDTQLDDGFHVRTLMGEGLTDHDEYWSRSEVQATSVADLHEHHRRHVEARGGVRGAAPTGTPFRQWIEYDSATEKERVQRVSGLSLFLAVTAIFFFVPALVCLLGIYLVFGAAALVRGAAVSLILGAGLFFVFIKILVPLAARGQLKLDLADAPPEPDAGP
jgi:hypothetical protein